MLPESRTPDEGFALPRFELTPRDVEGFLDELHTFHDHFRSCFARSEPRGHFFNYMVGQFSALERKSIEPMALEVAGGNVRGMQRLVAYLLGADKYLGPLASHLSGVSQPVISTRSVFSSLLPSLLADI
jgi:hypothetical protein